MRLVLMHTDFDGDILFPKYDASEWKPISRTDAYTEKNGIDGRLIECEIIDYVRTANADRDDIAPVLLSIRAVNDSFDQAEFSTP